MTSSISCSVDTLRIEVARASRSGELKRDAELSVTIPSYGPPLPTVPFANIAGGVFNPTARPFALDGTMFADNALPGRLAFARLSLLVVASALSALMKCVPRNRVNGEVTLRDSALPAKECHLAQSLRSGNESGS